MKRFAALVLAGAVLAGCAAGYAAGGTAGDPLISLRYLTGTWLPGLRTQAEERVETTSDRAYQTALAALNDCRTAAGGQPEGGAAASSGLTDRRVKRGDMLRLPTGSGLLLLAGSAQVIYAGGAVVDVTDGLTVGSSSALTPRHRYLAAENTAASVSITSDTAVICLEGACTITPSGEVDYNALAGALRDMGMFKGSDLGYGSGYDLERAPTRIEGLIMFLRLLGEEQAAQAYTGDCPFVDVPDWCRAYTAYAYAQGYTKGVGKDAAGRMIFGPQNTITAGEYVTFLLRTLGYRDSGADPDFAWNTSLAKGRETGVLTELEYQRLTERPFLRAQVAYLSYFALTAPRKDGGILLDSLDSRGSIDRAAVEAIMAGVEVQRLM